MTAILGAKADKSKAIDILENILHSFVTSGLAPLQAEGVRQHLLYLRNQTPDLNVNCKLETVPELQMTRVVLEYSFLPIPSMKS